MSTTLGSLPPTERVSLVLRLSRPLVDEAVERIEAELPTYAAELGPGELRRSFERSFALVLSMLVEQRAPTDAELQSLARHGARRAEAGLDLVDVTRSYRLGFLVIWEGLARLAREHGGHDVMGDPQDMVRIWWLHDTMAGTMEDGFRSRARQLDQHGDEHAQALLTALRGWPDAHAAVSMQARALGLDVTARWSVTAVSGTAGRLPRLVSGVCTRQPAGLVLLLPSPRGVDLCPERLRDLGWQHVGTGTAGVGMEGAALSLREAEHALRVAERLGRPHVDAERDWFTCLVGDDRAPVVPGLSVLEQTFSEDPTTAETVRAYLSADRNLTHAATRLFVHANTVSYRLRRLGETTGLDLRTLDGVLRACTVLARLGHDPTAP